MNDYEDDEEIKLIQISDTVYATEEELERSENAAELFRTIQDSFSPVRLLAASLMVLLFFSKLKVIYLVKVAIIGLFQEMLLMSK